MKICHENGCEREAKAGSLCYAHYQRQRRGSKKTTPVQPYGEGHDGVGTLRLPQPVAEFLVTEAKRLEISTYALACQIVKDAMDRLNSGGELWLTKAPAPLGQHTLVQVTHVSLTTEYANYVKHAAESLNCTTFALVNALIQDWYTAERAGRFIPGTRK